MQGLKDYVLNAGDGIEYFEIESGGDPDRFKSILARALDRYAPSVVIASNSYIAEWSVRSFRRLGVKHPAEVSLAVIDEPAWADIIEPPLSIELGRASCRAGEVQYV